MKNRIVLRTTTWHEEGEIVELYDFKKLDHYYNGLHACYRILCGNKYYYYIKADTSIISIDIFE